MYLLGKTQAKFWNMEKVIYVCFQKILRQIRSLSPLKQTHYFQAKLGYYCTFQFKRFKFFRIIIQDERLRQDLFASYRPNYIRFVRKISDYANISQSLRYQILKSENVYYLVRVRRKKCFKNLLNNFGGEEFFSKSSEKNQ